MTMVLNWNEDKIIASSSGESYDSDKVDSDIEAELYSIVHHQQETHQLNAEEEKSLNSSSAKYNKTYVGNLKVSIDNFISDRISDCVLYRNFEQQNDSFSNQKLSRNSNSLKRKSDTFTECLNDVQNSTSFTLHNVSYEESERKKSRRTSFKFSEIDSNSNVTNKLDTSDSDSDIIFIEPSDNEKLFQTNLSVQTVTINSDSEDSMLPFSQHSSSLNNQSTSSTDFTSKRNLEDLWFVNDEDLGRFKRISGRYHESAITYCSKCTQKGHTAKFCTYTKFVRCFLCGGKHSASKCKKRTCSACFEKAHDFRNCKRFLQICANCEMRGHGHKECPDVWRKYHLTTSKKFVPVQRLRQDTPLYCYNCGMLGHFGACCREEKKDKFCSITWPTLIDYDSPMNSAASNCSAAMNSASKKHSSPLPKLQLPKSTTNYMQRCSKEKREKILLKRKRRRELQKIKRQTISKEVNFPRTPKTQLKKSPNLNNSVDPNSSCQIVLSGKAMRAKKRMDRLRRKRLMYQEMRKNQSLL